ncbi:HelD family protein [Pseudochrobactrum lubricantis]|uniref:HelD family protein n=1 Tax=Pseudochrobactrum lubricantis TaxID=558172 RepID=UPI0035DED627
MTEVEREERERLQACRDRITENLQVISSRLSSSAKDIRETNEYMWEARRDLDHIDKIAMRQTIDQKTRSAELLRDRRSKLQKLQDSPYFGRLDFTRMDRNLAQAIYIGVHDFRDEESGETMVYDWRAPISSLYYDFETGPARYAAPSGEIAGSIELKRQFRIRDGELEFMLDSAVNIVDDLLQEELSRSSDEGMKQIVATIQRDQNAIIRDGEAHTLIIQGVAGSGKTSIALHRIAFLLYRFKDSLTSDDMLIISPNRVFADYIGNVLPELGEEKVGEIGMEALADELLAGKFRFETFFDQASRLLDRKNEDLRKRIRAKAQLGLLKKINEYVDHLEESSFQAAEWRPGLGKIVPEWHFREAWDKHRGLPVGRRIAEVVATTQHKVFQHYRVELDTHQRQDLRSTVKAMVRPTGLRAAYKGFYDWLGKPELFRPSASKLEWSDVFPLLWLKMKLEGIDNPRKDVKHLLIDEMQDYTPVQYAVLGKLFPCRKTILGDASQSVSPFGSSTAADIQKVLKTAPPVKLTKSYRSSYEIMRFALGISPNEELVPMRRHGENPRVVIADNKKQLLAEIATEVADFHVSDHRSLAIIAKTQKEASTLQTALNQNQVEAALLDADSHGFSLGVVICTAHLAKGLEFDRVIIPDASAEQYEDEMDRNLLYVACTRAMHKLTIFALRKASGLLPKGASST